LAECQWPFCPPIFDTKQDLFSLAIKELDECQNPLYLEFGVYQGESLRWWLNNLPAECARFIGFDSFEGLPQNWTDEFKKGHFATEIPQFFDDRVHLKVGYFDETLCDFVLPASAKKVINFDADLYSSTQTVLTFLGPQLVDGDLLYFDEFHLGEQKALSDFLSNSTVKVTPLASTRNLACWLLRVTE